MKQLNNKLTPAKGKHLKNKEGQIFEGSIWLGIYDDKSNYVEVTEEEYQASLEVMNNGYAH